MMTQAGGEGQTTLTGVLATAAPPPPAGAIYALLAGQIILALLMVLGFVLIMFTCRRVRQLQDTRTQASQLEHASENDVDAWVEAAHRLDETPH